MADAAGDFYWYHCVELGDGTLTDGDYDLRPLVHHYGLPDDMRDMRVLDVGCGSGFFSFEFERRGADVTATELGSFLDWDFVGGRAQREALAARIDDPVAYTRHLIRGAFEYARAARGSNVRAVTCNVYDLDPQRFGGRAFDLVFAGSLLSHLQDPIRALQALCSVTEGRCVVAAPSFAGGGVRAAVRRLARRLAGLEDAPLLRLVAIEDPDHRSWWTVNEQGLVQAMRAAGFAEAEIVSRFTMRNRRCAGLDVPHVVAHARP